MHQEQSISSSSFLKIHQSSFEIQIHRKIFQIEMLIPVYLHYSLHLQQMI